MVESKNNEKSQAEIITQILNPIQEGAIWGCSPRVDGTRNRQPKTRYTYPTMMKLDAVIP